MPIKRAETGFDSFVAGVVYFRGESEFSTPNLFVPNNIRDPGKVQLEDTPSFVIADGHIASTRRIDDRRLLELNKEGKVVGITFRNSREEVIFDGLPLTDDLVTEARDLFDAYHTDQQPK